MNLADIFAPEIEVTVDVVVAGGKRHRLGLRCRVDTPPDMLRELLSMRIMLPLLEHIETPRLDGKPLPVTR